MKIITKSVHLVDYENGITRTIDPPEAFEEYIVELISHINDNTTVRQFTTISRRTEVISSILDTRFHIDDSEAIQNNSNIIANRLLIKESQAQERIEHLDIQVQKGSLILCIHSFPLDSAISSLQYNLLLT